MSLNPTKTIAIIGITGNQGSSVANTFISKPHWRVRGLTRNPSSASSKSWEPRGAEILHADLDDIGSLKTAFRGVSAVFSVTNFWQEFGVQENWGRAKAAGKSINEIAYEIEVQRGRNVVDAAAAVLAEQQQQQQEEGEGVERLERLVMSVAADCVGETGGKIKGNYHCDAKWAAVQYLRSRYPDLAKITSLFHAGVYLTNWEAGGLNSFNKQPDGTYLIRLPVRPSTPMPFFHPQKDTGLCVSALVSAAAGKNLAGCGSMMSWSAVCQHLTQEFSAIGAKFAFSQCTSEEYMELVPGPAGPELAEMWRWVDEYGYFGSNPTVIYPKDLGIDKEMTTVEQYMTKDGFAVLVESAPTVGQM